eukprot:559632-Pelagomonas_calceolata.AAC.1
MRMRTHIHAELIQNISNILEHSPHTVHFFKVIAHSGIVGNEGLDTCARAAALTDTVVQFNTIVLVPCSTAARLAVRFYNALLRSNKKKSLR